MKKRAFQRISVIFIMVIILLSSFSVYTVYAEEYNCAEGKHKFVETERIPATETADGQITYICELCGRKYTDIIFATSHIWGEWVIDKESACTEPGSKHRHCSQGAGHDETQAIPATGHKYTVKTTAPTATKDGYKTYTCSVCGHSYTEKFGAATGHHYIETITKEPSCETAGIKTFTREDGGDSYTEAIPAIGHHFGEWITDLPAAAGMEGKRHKVCANCGSVMEEMTEALPPVPDIPTPNPKEPLFNVTDAVVAGVNVSLIALFSLLIFSDMALVSWDKKKKKELLERLERERMEADRFDFI